jgi:membrane associated rhomboid family serine protease
MMPGPDPRYPPPGPYGAPPPYQGYPPQAYPYASQATTAQDIQHLKMLAVFHFVYAGLLGLLGLFFVIYIVLGVFLATAAVSSGSGGGGPEAGAIGGVFVVLGAFAMFFTWGKAGLLIWSGISLRAHRRMTRSFVVAILTCLNVPIGTALGIATIMALNRPSVKALYQETERAGA